MKTNAKTVFTTSALITAFLLLGAIVLLIPLLPRVVDWYLAYRAPTVTPYRSVILWLLFPALVFAACAMLAMLHLLFLVRRGAVFTGGTLRDITLISLCAFAEAVLFAGLGMTVFPCAFLIGGAALFLCVTLLVLRCVLSEAIGIKAENDYTV